MPFTKNKKGALPDNDQCWYQSHAEIGVAQLLRLLYVDVRVHY